MLTTLTIVWYLTMSFANGFVPITFDDTTILDGQSIGWYKVYECEGASHTRTASRTYDDIQDLFLEDIVTFAIIPKGNKPSEIADFSTHAQAVATKVCSNPVLAVNHQKSPIMPVSTSTWTDTQSPSTAAWVDAHWIGSAEGKKRLVTAKYGGFPLNMGSGWFYAANYNPTGIHFGWGTCSWNGPSNQGPGLSLWFGFAEKKDKCCQVNPPNSKGSLQSCQLSEPTPKLTDYSAGGFVDLWQYTIKDGENLNYNDPTSQDENQFRTRWWNQGRTSGECNTGKVESDNPTWNKVCVTYTDRVLSQNLGIDLNLWEEDCGWGCSWSHVANAAVRNLRWQDYPCDAANKNIRVSIDRPNLANQVGHVNIDVRRHGSQCLHKANSCPTHGAFELCATESGTCKANLKTSGFISYGYNGKFVFKYLSATDSKNVACNVGTFGSDPNVGQHKFCCYSSVVSPCTDPTTMYTALKGKVYACREKIVSGGTRGANAKSACGRGFHVCKSAVELTGLGFSTDTCNAVKSKHPNMFFGTQQSSNGNLACTMDTDNDLSSTNDVFGCGGNANANMKCGPLTGWIGNTDWNHWKLVGSSTNEVNGYTLTDASSGGVLCCKDDNDVINFGIEFAGSWAADDSIDVVVCWNSNKYQSTFKGSAVGWRFVALSPDPSNKCEGDHTIDFAWKSTKNSIEIKNVKIIHVNSEGTSGVYRTNSLSQSLELSVDNPASAIAFPNNFASACGVSSSNCVGMVSDAKNLLKYQLKLDLCDDSKTTLGVILKGDQGNLVRSVSELHGHEQENLIGVGNIGKLLEIVFEYESSDVSCIRKVAVSDPTNENKFTTFGEEYFGDGVLLKKECRNNGFENIPSSGTNVYLPCFDVFSVKVYEQRQYLSVRLKTCVGSDAGLKADVCPATATTCDQVTMQIVSMTKSNRWKTFGPFNLLQPNQAWDAGTARDYTFSIDASVADISTVMIGNSADDSLCIDQVTINQKPAFLNDFWVGAKERTKVIPAVAKWPICKVEYKMSLTGKVSSVQDTDKTSDTESVRALASLKCVNHNRLIGSTCEVEQTFDTYDEVEISNEMGEEIFEEKLVASGTETTVSVGGSLSVFYQSEVGSENTAKVTKGGEISASFQHDWTSSSSTETTNGKTFLNTTVNTRTGGKSRSVECAGSVDLPPSQELSYVLNMKEEQLKLETKTTLIMTKCSKYLHPDGDDNSDEHIETTEFTSYIYVKQGVSCEVAFGQATPLKLGMADGLTCGQERALAAREFGTFVPFCTGEDGQKYEKCQCDFSHALTQPTCGCVDENFGNLDEKKMSAVIDTEFNSWQQWCNDKCGTSFPVPKPSDEADSPVDTFFSAAKAASPNTVNIGSEKGIEDKDDTLALTESTIVIFLYAMLLMFGIGVCFIGIGVIIYCRNSCNKSYHAVSDDDDLPSVERV